MADYLVWLFGCGLSIDCGLRWRVPSEFQQLDREVKVVRIKEEVRAAMNSPEVDTTPIRSLLAFLADRTAPGWQHLFITTNWDFLLQREVESFITDGYQPPWLVDTQVFHLNGTVEQRSDNSNRSPFLLEEDSFAKREWTLEANDPYNKMIWERNFVAVGMSFECETDRFLLQSLHSAQNDMPIGESSWIIVNPDPAALDRSAERIQEALPSCEVHRRYQTFSHWLTSGLPELASLGVFTKPGR